MIRELGAAVSAEHQQRLSQLSWSRGQYDLRKRFAVEIAASDAEAASEELPDAECCVEIPGHYWDQAHKVERFLRFIEAAERGGSSAVDELLRAYLRRLQRKERDGP